MNWFFFALISVVSISVANLIQKTLMKNSDADPYSFTIVFTFMCAIITAVFALIKGFNPPPIKDLGYNFIISALFYGFGMVLTFKALKTLDASENILLAPLGTIVTIASAVILLNESFGLMKIIGATLIFIPIFLLSKTYRFKFNKGIFFAACSAILFGLAVTNDAFILKTYDAVSYTPIIFLLPCIILILTKPLSLQKFKSIIISKQINSILLFSLFYSLQAITYYLALDSGSGASNLSAIFKAETMLTVILAATFLKETRNLNFKITGAISTTLGVLLLS